MEPMRQGQQNRRGRGRNRKSQNPLTRSFESNGPDIKIRGTPSHIAEKYVSLARDALSSGDRVLAENYLQHAEHYNRIIMAYREQQVTQPEGAHGGGHARDRDQHDMSDQDDDGHGDDGLAFGDESVPRGHEPQPTVLVDEDQDGGGRGRRTNGDGRRRRGPEEATEEGSAGGTRSRPRRRERYAQRDDQPDFLKRPIRKPRPSNDAADAESGASDNDASSGEAEADNAA
jgi:hypothetical protein